MLICLETVGCSLNAIAFTPSKATTLNAAKENLREHHFLCQAVPQQAIWGSAWALGNKSRCDSSQKSFLSRSEVRSQHRGRLCKTTIFEPAFALDDREAAPPSRIETNKTLHTQLQLRSRFTFYCKHTHTRDRRHALKEPGREVPSL